MAERAQDPRSPVEPEVVFHRSARADEQALQDARLLARLLDDLFTIPGTRFRVGLDPLLGLVPGAGDLVGAVLSTWILVLAGRLGAPASVLARMAANVGVDALVGAIPFAGDLFDAAWKANARNVKLLEAWLARPAHTRRASRLLVAGLVAAVLAVVAAIGFAAVSLVAWAWRAIASGGAVSL